MNLNKSALSIAIAAAVGLGGQAAQATVPGTPGTLASEVNQSAPLGLNLDSTTTTLIGEILFNTPDISTIDNANFTLIYQLSGGARFGSGTSLVIACTGAHGTVSADGFTLANGGASATSATVIFDGSAVLHSDLAGCTVTISGTTAATATGTIVLPTGGLTTLTVTVSGNGLLIGQSIGFSTAGAIMTADQAIGASAAAAATATLDVVSGFVNFISAGTNTAIVTSGGTLVHLGRVNYVPLSAAQDINNSAISAIDVAAQTATLTVGGPPVAGLVNVTGASVYLSTTGTCSGGTTFNTGTFNTAGGTVAVPIFVSGTGAASGGLITGAEVCLNTNGTNRVTEGTTTITIGLTSNTGYNANATQGNGNGATLDKNGVTRTVYNIPNSGNADRVFARVYNRTNTQTGRVFMTMYDQAGTTLCSNVTVTSTLAPRGVFILQSQGGTNNFETLCGATWTGRAWAELDIELRSAEVATAIRSSTGTLTNFSSVDESNP